MVAGVAGEGVRLRGKEGRCMGQTVVGMCCVQFISPQLTGVELLVESTCEKCDICIRWCASSCRWRLRVNTIEHGIAFLASELPDGRFMCGASRHAPLQALTEHRNPDTLKKLNDAERAKKEKEQQEYFDPSLGEQEREKGECSSSPTCSCWLCWIGFDCF